MAETPNLVPLTPVELEGLKVSARRLSLRSVADLLSGIEGVDQNARSQIFRIIENEVTADNINDGAVSAFTLGETMADCESLSLLASKNDLAKIQHAVYAALRNIDAN